jgi:hypothetical protein
MSWPASVCPPAYSPTGSAERLARSEIAKGREELAGRRHQHARAVDFMFRWCSGAVIGAVWLNADPPSPLVRSRDSRSRGRACERDLQAANQLKVLALLKLPLAKRLILQEDGTVLTSSGIQLNTAERAHVRALVSKEARDTLARFDSERDLKMRHEEALGVLRAMRAHESDDLAVRVGTAWAHIHHADLAHLLRDGASWLDESRSTVARLEASEASEEPFAAYVLARWHTAAGRIRFRLGDARTARDELTAAAKRATREDLWFCRADILSTLLRVRTDEHARVGTANEIRVVVRRFSTLREVMNRLAGRHGIDLGGVTALSGKLSRYLDAGGTGELGVSRERLADIIGLCDDREARRRCELLRGLVTLHFNRALLYAPNPRRGWAGDRDRSRELAWWCARAAFGVGDRHRLAQALRHLNALEAC